MTVHPWSGRNPSGTITHLTPMLTKDDLDQQLMFLPVSTCTLSFCNVWATRAITRPISSPLQESTEVRTPLIQTVQLNLFDYGGWFSLGPINLPPRRPKCASEWPRPPSPEHHQSGRPCFNADWTHHKKQRWQCSEAAIRKAPAGTFEPATFQPNLRAP